jgi:hypothetical protein
MPVNKIWGDNESLYFGTDKDVSLTFDGTGLDIAGYITGEISLKETASANAVVEYVDTDNTILGNVGFARGTNEFFTGTAQNDLAIESIFGEIVFATNNVERMALTNAGALQIKDSTGNDRASFSHDGTDFNVDFVSTTDVNYGPSNTPTWHKFFSTSSGGMWLLGGGELRIYDSLSTSYMTFDHNSTDFRMVGTSTNYLSVDTTNGQKFLVGGSERARIDSDGFLLIGDRHLELDGGGAGRVKVWTESIADDATSTFTSPGSTTFALWIVQSQYDDALSGMMFSNVQSISTVFSGGSNSQGDSGTNPDVDGNLNMWMSSSGVLSVKNRIGSTRNHTVMCITH